MLRIVVDNDGTDVDCKLMADALQDSGKKSRKYERKKEE
jgi:hypothetical protein